MKSLVNGSINTFGLTLIPAFSRRNGRRSKNPFPRQRGRKGRRRVGREVLPLADASILKV